MKEKATQKRQWLSCVGHLTLPRATRTRVANARRDYCPCPDFLAERTLFHLELRVVQGFVRQLIMNMRARTTRTAADSMDIRLPYGLTMVLVLGLVLAGPGAARLMPRPA